MTHNQLPIETSNGWTGFFEAETSQEKLRTQSKDEVHPEKPTDDSESSKYNNDEKNEDFRKMDEKDKNDKETDKEDGEQKVYCLDYCCCRFFPRISLLFVGIFFPLWTLISISTLFGFALSAVESPQEVNLNDMFMARRTEIMAFSAEAKNFTREIPKICLKIYLEKSRQSNVHVITKMIQGLFFNASQYPPLLQDTVNLTELVLINVTDLDEHMKACGIACDPIVDRLLSSLIDAYQNLPGGLTFNWIRCFDGAFDELNISNLRPDAQKEYYQSVWEMHQQELYNEFLEEEMDRIQRFPELEPTLNASAEYRAFNRSIHEATGGTGCDYNTAASVWFWFTVMTTMGYGNQAPLTWQGRALIFSLGFLSVLLFGVILQRAGRVTSVLFDDSLSHFQMRILSRSWFLCAIWGIIYYGYMLINAYYIKSWKASRLGDTISLGEGYWFSFISFTTIGLGDYFIEPEVLLPKDMVSLPFIYLVGFTFFAAFLENILACFPKGKNFRLLDALIGRIQNRDESGVKRDSQHTSSER